MKDRYIPLPENGKLGFEEVGLQGCTAVLVCHDTPSSRIAGLEESTLMEHFDIRIITSEWPGYCIFEPLPNRKTALIFSATKFIPLRNPAKAFMLINNYYSP